MRRQKSEETTSEEKGLMRAVLGEVNNWLVSGSRPDLAAAYSLMQQKATKSTVEDLIRVNKLVSMVRDFANFEVQVLPIKKEEVEIVAWSDASFANATNRSSQGGYI